MTNKEAAKCLKCIRHYMEGEECWTDAEFESMDMAIKEIEKDIPKTPIQPYIRYGMGYEYYDYFCPSCGTMLCLEPQRAYMKSKMRCRRCGQQINWDEDKNDKRNSN